MISNGVFVMTARIEDTCYASTVTWVTQTSFDPPMVASALRTDSGIYHGVRTSRQFALHIVGQDQKSFAASFFRASKSDGRTISGYPYSLSLDGIPILADAPVFIECKVVKFVEEGDHHVVLGQVVDARVRDGSTPLILRDTDWTYGG